MIRDRFEQTREAVIELDRIHALIATEGDDWKPEGARGNGIGDPTASRAIRNVDVWGAKLEALRKREAELVWLIGGTLQIIEGVRKCFGAEYADILDQRYIDCLPWSEIVVDGETISRSNGWTKLNVVFDWIDSVGITRLLEGDCGEL